jgi:hypothetical protein
MDMANTNITDEDRLLVYGCVQIDIDHGDYDAEGACSAWQESDEGFGELVDRLTMPVVVEMYTSCVARVRAH